VKAQTRSQTQNLPCAKGTKEKKGKEKIVCESKKKNKLTQKHSNGEMEEIFSLLFDNPNLAVKPW